MTYKLWGVTQILIRSIIREVIIKIRSIISGIGSLDYDMGQVLSYIGIRLVSIVKVMCDESLGMSDIGLLRI